MGGYITASDYNLVWASNIVILYNDIWLHEKTLLDKDIPKKDP